MANNKLKIKPRDNSKPDHAKVAQAKLVAETARLPADQVEAEQALANSFKRASRQNKLRLTEFEKTLQKANLVAQGAAEDRTSEHERHAVENVAGPSGIVRHDDPNDVGQYARVAATGASQGTEQMTGDGMEASRPQNAAAPSSQPPVALTGLREQDDASSDSEHGDSAPKLPESEDVDGNQPNSTNPVTAHAADQVADRLARTGLSAAKVSRSLNLNLEELQDLIVGTARAVASTATKPAVEGMTNFAAQLANLTQVMQTMQARPTEPRSQIRIRDIRLSEFSGNSDPKANHISESYFLPLIRWMKEGQSTLKLSGLSVLDQCTVVLNHLTGAARSAFFAKYGNTDRSQWCLNDMYRAIANLVPDYEVLFTRAAFEMKFQIKTLKDDIDTFAMYLRHGSIHLDGNHFIFCELQRKMIAACPKIFTIAADWHNLRLVWLPESPFLSHIQKAIDIVTVLQTNQQLQQQQIDQLVGGSSNSEGKQAEEKIGWKDATRKRKAENREGNKPAKERKVDATRKSRFTALAKEYNRCRNCGRYVADSNWAEHKKSDKCDVSQFNRRMGQVAKMVDQGKGAQVNAFAKSDK
jgi:hypothetical protein